MLLTRSFGRTTSSNRSSASIVRRAGATDRVGCEMLEKREVFSLAGVTLGELPVGSFNSTGVITYDAASDTLDMKATPLNVFFSNGTRSLVATHGDISIGAKVDGAGNLISGITGDDFVLRGGLDIDGNGTIDAGETGVLLTGEINKFGSLETGSTTDVFDFQFKVTGGLLASQFAGKDVGIVMASEGSTFSGSFASNFTGGAKGNFGPTTPEPERGRISGQKFLDVTGNGLSSDDTVLSGVTIFLDTNNNGQLDNGEITDVTDATGSWSFDNLAAGQYTVREVVPTGYVRTGPVLQDHYSVTLATGQVVSGLNFANAQTDCKCAIKDVKYTIERTKQDRNCKDYTKTYCVSDLRGNTEQGDKVNVTFTVKAGQQPQVFTLVAYKAPGSTFVASDAHLQTIYDIDTGLFGPGTHTLSVTLPDCYYQVDFVCGEAIDKFGPAGSNIFYTPQKRLISADNGGKNACKDCECDGSISGYVYKDKDNDGKKESGENGIEGVKITLTWYEKGQKKTLTRYTDSNGKYTFDGLKEGKYTIVESQPKNYDDGKESTGSAGGDKENDKFSNICLDSCEDATNYNFGEVAKKDNNGGCDWNDWWNDKNDWCDRDDDRYCKDDRDHKDYNWSDALAGLSKLFSKWC